MVKIISLTTSLLLTLNTVFAAEAGMPQLDPTYWASQVFWLTIIFSAIYFLIAKIFVPKIKGNIDARESQIRKDIDEANSLKEEADRKLLKYNGLIDEAKLEARKILSESWEEVGEPLLPITSISDELAHKIRGFYKKIKIEAFSKDWKWFATIGLVNLVIPFILISYGVNFVQSNLAAILMSTTPLSSTVLAHFFLKGEKFNFLKTISNPQIAWYSTLIEPYFMLSGSFLLASMGLIFSPFYIFLIVPLAFLNRKFIFLILKRLGSLKGKVFEVLRLPNSKDQFEERINIISFFPTRALFLEIGFVLSKFIGFYICLNSFYPSNSLNIIFLLVIFSLSWSLGLIVPAAPGGVGVFEACLLLFVGKSIPQNIIIINLVYFRVISTSADLFLSLPFLIRKLYKRI